MSFSCVNCDHSWSWVTTLNPDHSPSCRRLADHEYLGTAVVTTAVPGYSWFVYSGTSLKHGLEHRLVLLPAVLTKLYRWSYTGTSAIWTPNWWNCKIWLLAHVIDVMLFYFSITKSGYTKFGLVVVIFMVWVLKLRWLQCLLVSMPHRFQAIIKARGRHDDYQKVFKLIFGAIFNFLRIRSMC